MSTLSSRCTLSALLRRKLEAQYNFLRTTHDVNESTIQPREYINLFKGCISLQEAAFLIGGAASSAFFQNAYNAETSSLHSSVTENGNIVFDTPNTQEKIKYSTSVQSGVIAAAMQRVREVAVDITKQYFTTGFIVLERQPFEQEQDHLVLVSSSDPIVNFTRPYAKRHRAARKGTAHVAEHTQPVTEESSDSSSSGESDSDIENTDKKKLQKKRASKYEKQYKHDVEELIPSFVDKTLEYLDYITVQDGQHAEINMSMQKNPPDLMYFQLTRDPTLIAYVNEARVISIVSCSAFQIIKNTNIPRFMKIPDSTTTLIKRFAPTEEDEEDIRGGNISDIMRLRRHLQTQMSNDKGNIMENETDKTNTVFHGSSVEYVINGSTTATPLATPQLPQMAIKFAEFAQQQLERVMMAIIRENSNRFSETQSMSQIKAKPRIYGMQTICEKILIVLCKIFDVELTEQMVLDANNLVKIHITMEPKDTKAALEHLVLGKDFDSVIGTSANDKTQNSAYQADETEDNTSQNKNANFPPYFQAAVDDISKRRKLE